MSVNVRILPPNHTMACTGYPTLGTAYLAPELSSSGGTAVLPTGAGDVRVQLRHRRRTLPANGPVSLRGDVARSGLAARLGAGRGAGDPWWVDTGAPTLFGTHSSPRDVPGAPGDLRLLARFATRAQPESLVYLWGPTGPDTVKARFFFTQRHLVIQDPATGSAWLNLGGRFVANGEQGNRRRTQQARARERRSGLDPTVGDGATIVASGAWSTCGRGRI